jgi:chromosome segregation ATPase
MTKEQLQQELKKKITAGVKPSDIKKLKKSKSADDIPASSTPNIPLKKSNSQLEIPVTQQPSLQEQIIQLKNSVKFHAQTATNYLQSLQTSQARVSELEKQLKTHPPNQLLSDQLKEKQQEVENLRSKLDDSNQKLTETTAKLDNSLLARYEAVKQFGLIYEKLKQISQELDENVQQASDELENKDETVKQLRTIQQNTQTRIRELEGDLNLAYRLIKLKKYPLPDDGQG